MREIEAVAATTHLDSHNERLAREGVEMMVRQYNETCIPMWVQHDPRIPPVGRFLRAEARELPDGELAVVAYGEMWEPGDSVPFLPDRKMPLGHPGHDKPFLRFDRGFADQVDATTCDEIEAMIGSTPHIEVKKALDPLAILTLGGTFLAGAIANGLIGAMTTDAYNALKECVKKFFQRRREALAAQNADAESLFVFKAFVKDEEGFCVVDVIITKPTDDDLDRFFKYGLHRLDEELEKALRDRRQIQRIVIEIDGREFKVKYGVRSDAVPVAAIY
jgi:Flp pilus assembly pilin Flp